MASKRETAAFNTAKHVLSQYPDYLDLTSTLVRYLPGDRAHVTRGFAPDPVDIPHGQSPNRMVAVDVTMTDWSPKTTATVEIYPDIEDHEQSDRAGQAALWIRRGQIWLAPEDHAAVRDSARRILSVAAHQQRSAARLIEHALDDWETPARMLAMPALPESDPRDRGVTAARTALRILTAPRGTLVYTIGWREDPDSESGDRRVLVQAEWADWSPRSGGRAVIELSALANKLKVRAGRLADIDEGLRFAAQMALADARHRAIATADAIDAGLDRDAESQSSPQSH